MNSLLSLSQIERVNNDSGLFMACMAEQLIQGQRHPSFPLILQFACEVW